MLGVLEGIGNSFNGAQSGGKRVSLAHVIILGGCAAVEQAASNAGHDVEVPFAPARTDAVREQTNVESCAGCFDDAGYFRSILELTAQRLEAVRRLRLTVLSSSMPRELIQRASRPTTSRSPGAVGPGHVLPAHAAACHSDYDTGQRVAVRVHDRAFDGAGTLGDRRCCGPPRQQRGSDAEQNGTPQRTSGGGRLSGVSRGSRSRAARSSTRRCSPMG